MTITYGPRRGQIINALAGESYPDAWRKLLRALDALTMCSVTAIGVNDPPGTPANGDAYTVGVGTGAWTGHDNAIAVWTTDDPTGPKWEFYPATEGMVIWNKNDRTLWRFDSSAWATPIIDNLAQISVNGSQRPNLNFISGSNISFAFSNHGLDLTISAAGGGGAVEYEVASGAIGIIEGLALISVDDTTIALTVATLPEGRARDGKVLRIASITRLPHTVVMFNQILPGSFHTITFGAGTTDNSVNFIDLLIYNSQWLCLASSGVALS
jgi:hypothetical protein